MLLLFCCYLLILIYIYIFSHIFAYLKHFIIIIILYTRTHRNIVHTVGPKYNEKYRTAAINSLNKCYLNALQLCVDTGFETVAFIPIHRTQRQYPVDLGTNIACRTVRRFLEHFADKVRLIVLCSQGAEYQAAYRETLPKYFPRSQREAVATNEVLPDDVGNEWGESFSEERQIRISALPGMTDEEYDEENEGDSDGDAADEAPIVVSATGQSHKPALAAKTPNPDRRFAKSRQAAAAAAAVANEAGANGVYDGFIEEARQRDFSDLEQMGFFYHAGRDPQTEQEVVIFLCPKYNNITVSQERLSAYFVKVMDELSRRPYTLVYLHSTVSERQLPTAWLRAFDSNFPQRYTTNMRLLVVYPTWSLKAFVSVVGRFTFLANISITYVNSLAELYRWLPPKLIRIPLEISQNDPSVAHDLQTTDDLYDNL